MTLQSGTYEDMSGTRPGRNLLMAYILWFFFGFLGGHRYYVRHFLKGLVFLVGTVAATALSAVNVTRIGGIVLGGLLVIFWIVDAIKLPKLVAAAGAERPVISD